MDALGLRFKRRVKLVSAQIDGRFGQFCDEISARQSVTVPVNRSSQAVSQATCPDCVKSCGTHNELA